MRPQQGRTGKLLRWDPGVTPFALAGAIAAALLVSRHVQAQLAIPRQSGPVHLFGGLGWVELVLTGLPVLIAVGALVPGRDLQIAILTFGFAGLFLGVLKGEPLYLELHSPGLQLILPMTLVGVALVSAFRRRGPAPKSGPRGGRAFGDRAR